MNQFWQAYLADFDAESVRFCRAECMPSSSRRARFLAILSGETRNTPAVSYGPLSGYNTTQAALGVRSMPQHLAPSKFLGRTVPVGLARRQ